MATGAIHTPKTYPQAVVHAVRQAGMLSRAGLTSECKKLGFEKASCLKTALSKCIKEGLVVIDSASYLLSDTLRKSSDKKSESEYAKRLTDALVARNTTHKEKKASRKRAEATYRKNLKKAGGLTLKAQADATWAKRGNHGNSSSRFIGEGIFSL